MSSELEIPNCPICRTRLEKKELTTKGYLPEHFDYECPNCHRQFELLEMSISPISEDEYTRNYKLRGKRIIKTIETVSEV
jgi:transposase-like protein